MAILLLSMLTLSKK